MNLILTVDETARLIRSGSWLSLAGSKEALAKLPKGNWIGGTSHYFMGPEGGLQSDDKVFVTKFDGFESATIARYEPGEVDRILSDSPEHGYSVVIIPTGSETLRRFAQRGYSELLFLRPVIGWIAGIRLDKIGQSTAAVFAGDGALPFEEGAVVMHVAIPKAKIAKISIVDPFSPKPSPVIKFEKAGFTAQACLIDGIRFPLKEILEKNAYADGRLPLIGDFNGANVNVSIQSIDRDGLVHFYAPVFEGVEYHFSNPIESFSDEFSQRILQYQSAEVTFSCNCILNYLHGGLEGKKTGHAVGPITFGEIAYQLLNQTMVILEIV